jgi:hypothetical protein
LNRMVWETQPFGIEHRTVVWLDVSAPLQLCCM